MWGLQREKSLRLNRHEITFEVLRPMWPHYLNVTNRQKNGRFAVPIHMYRALLGIARKIHQVYGTRRVMFAALSPACRTRAENRIDTTCIYPPPPRVGVAALEFRMRLVFSIRTTMMHLLESERFSTKCSVVFTQYRIIFERYAVAGMTFNPLTPTVTIWTQL